MSKAEKTSLDKKSDEFRTPQKLFDELNKEFEFTIDAAAQASNALLPKWTNDAGNHDFTNERVWCNPPYSRGHVIHFVEMAHFWVTRPVLSERSHLWVLLVPTRTEQDWFHNVVLPNHEVRFIRGRIKFGGGNWAARDSHMLIIMRDKGAGEV